MSKKDNYKNIKDSHETGFENDSNKALVDRHRKTMNAYLREDISLEMNRRLIDEIEVFNKQSTKQSKTMIKLTYWIIALTIALGIISLVQLVLLLRNLI